MIAFLLGGGALVATLVLTAAAELAAPAFAPAPAGDEARIRTNALLGIVGLLGDALLPLGVSGTVSGTRGLGFGLLPWLGAPPAVSVPATFLLLGLSQYTLHRLAHRWTWLWRLHRVHHSDTALDISTAFRHHPLDRLVAIVWTGGIAILLGLEPVTIAVYGIAALLLAIPQHADLSLGDRLERWLGPWIVTPGVHHVHHSADALETDSNYGDLFTIWDRILGTWQPRTLAERQAMRIGLGGDHDIGAGSFRRQLAAPFRR